MKEGVWVPKGVGILGTAEPLGDVGVGLLRGSGPASSLLVPQEAVALNLHWGGPWSHLWVVGGLHLQERAGDCRRAGEPLVHFGEQRDV